MRREKPRLNCTFCDEPLPEPSRCFAVYSADGCLGGRCGCGAVFVIDDTGKSGGQAVLDLQALAADGDLDRAIKLETGRDIEIADQPIPRRAMPSALPRGGYSHVPPRLWLARLIAPKTE